MRRKTLVEFQRAYPWIKWGEPLRILAAGGGEGDVCRICVANYGLRAGSLGEWTFPTREEFDEHMRTAHG